MRENQHDAIHVTVEMIRSKLNEAQVLVTEERAGRCVRLLLSDHVGSDQGAEVSLLGAALLDDLDAALAGEKLGVDDVDVLSEAEFEQAGRESSRHQPGAPPGGIAAIMQLGPADGALAHLGVQES